MTPKAKRLLITFIAGLLLVIAAILAMTALRDNIVFFVTPSELTDAQRGQDRLRLGGLVADGSVRIKGTRAEFTITDEEAHIDVRYDGALPDLFREGQGIIAEGAFEGAFFIADTVLAKHDENYMPREVKESLEAQGVWKGQD